MMRNPSKRVIDLAQEVPAKAHGGSMARSILRHDMRAAGNPRALTDRSYTAVRPVALPRLQKRTDLHLARKLYHLSMGMLIAGLYWGGVSRFAGVMILSSILGVAILVETSRLRFPAFNAKLIRFWGPVMRQNEVSRVTGIPFYLLSNILAILLFPKTVAVLAILYLACGDPFASLCGVLWGDAGPRFRSGKSLIGTLGGVVVCMAISMVFLQTLALPLGTLVLLSLIGGIAGGTAELVPLDLDDNFTIPVVSGFVLWLAFIVLGI